MLSLCMVGKRYIVLIREGSNNLVLREYVYIYISLVLVLILVLVLVVDSYKKAPVYPSCLCLSFTYGD